MPRQSVLATIAVATLLTSGYAVPATAGSTPPRLTPALGASAFAGAQDRLDLRILVLDDGDSGVDAMTSRLDEEGVSYRRVDLNDAARPQLTESFLTGTDARGPYGRFSGVILPNESPAALSDTEKATLAAYERAYRVRQVASYTWPNPALGFDWPQWSGVVDGMTTTVTPAAKTLGWGYLKGPVTLDDGDPNVDESYGYLAPALPADQLQPGQSFTPLLTAPIPGSDASGVLMGEFADNGQETLVLGFSNNQWVTQFKVFGHGIVSWLTRGVSTGLYRNWFSIHSDDLFLPDDRWSIEGHCTRGADCDETEYPSNSSNWIRMDAQDVSALVAWQRKSGLKIDQVFNGAGSGQYTKETGKPDGLLAALKANASAVRFVNHTWEHTYLGCVQNWDVDPWECARTPSGAITWASKQHISSQISKNVAFARKHRLPLVASELVTGEHSGLKSLPQMAVDNPNLGPALRENGIRTVASDASRETAVRPIGSARTIPRHPMNIFYNVGTKAEEVSEYNWIYTSREDGGSGYCTDHPETETCIEPLDPVTGFDDYIVPIETRIAFSHIAANDPMPHYANQSNLADERILYPVLDSILATYRRTYAANAPIVNARQTTAAAALANQQAWRATTGVTARLEGRTVTLTNRSAQSVLVPMTLPEGTKRNGTPWGQRYAGARSAWVTLAAGASTRFQLAAATAYGSAGERRETPSAPSSSTPKRWVPTQGTDWQIQYSGRLDLSRKVPVYDIDWEDTTKAQVTKLRTSGRHAICYLSAGSWENWRSDAGAFPDRVKGRPLSGWNGERWLDTRALKALLPIMAKRMDVCKAKGFEAVDPDNVDGYQNATGFPLTKADSTAYLRALGQLAHQRGMSIGLKNAIDLIPTLGSEMDFAVNESCEQCSGYRPMVNAGKAILHIEYKGPISAVCANRPAQFSTLLKNRRLDAAILGSC